MKEMEEILSQFGPLETKVSFKTMTTLRIGGIADYVSYPKNVTALDGLVTFLKKKDIPFKTLGRGSNLLCSEEPFHGVVIRLDRLDDVFVVNDTVVAEAGVSIIALSYQVAKLSLSGLEFAAGIPASVGGTAYMNAGAYKSSMQEVIDSVLVYRNGTLTWMNSDECEFSYRTSIFQSHPDWIIVAVKYQLEKGNASDIKELMNSRRERRMASQPLDAPSAGSVFRNPLTVPAWQLIEGIGYRGKTHGGAMVSNKHVNFIVNTGKATADDFLNLVQEIVEKVDAQYGIELHMEVECFNWKNNPNIKM